VSANKAQPVREEPVNRTAFVTGADRGLGLGLVGALLQRDWTVVAGHLEQEPTDLQALGESLAGTLYPVRMDVSDMQSVRRAAEATSRKVTGLDLIINNAGVLGRADLENTIRSGLDYDEIKQSVDVNSLGPMRVVQELLGLMNASALKRLCFISSEASSIARSNRTSWFGYCMSKTALNMGVSIIFNDLRADGFTFRVYHPGWMQTFMKGVRDDQAKYSPEEAAELALGYFLNDSIDEDTLVMRDDQGESWPW
jgi:NAD(P)-dependent dehydrogenase (short-subunit alcohol dehydrogenase family)